MSTTTLERPYHKKYELFSQKAQELESQNTALDLLEKAIILLNDTNCQTEVDQLFQTKGLLEQRILKLKSIEQGLYDELNAGNLRHVFYELMTELGKTREELAMSMMESVDEINDVLDKGRVDEILLYKLCSYFSIKVTYNLKHYQRLSSGGRR